MDIGKSTGHKTITVATVGAYSTVSGLPLPGKESNDEVISDLLRRTKSAADFGAKLIVWNEASFYTLPSEEEPVDSSIQDLAREKSVSIVASYVMPVSEKPFRHENKLAESNIGAAICYDYDFPNVAREYGKLKAALMKTPE